MIAYRVIDHDTGRTIDTLHHWCVFRVSRRGYGFQVDLATGYVVSVGA